MIPCGEGTEFSLLYGDCSPVQLPVQTKGWGAGNRASQEPSFHSPENQGRPHPSNERMDVQVHYLPNLLIHCAYLKYRAWSQVLSSSCVPTHLHVLITTRPGRGTSTLSGMGSLAFYYFLNKITKLFAYISIELASRSHLEVT